MKTYTVTVKEVHDSFVTIQANSPEEALEMIKRGDGHEVDIEYNRTLPSDTWYVHEDGTTCEGCNGEGTTGGTPGGNASPCDVCHGSGLSTP